MARLNRQSDRRQCQWQRALRYYYYRLLRLQSTPKALARGLAAGVFAGCFPLFGFQTLMGLGLSVPLKGNKLLAAAGTWISNPFTYVPIYWFNFQLGRRILGTQDQAFTLANLDSWQSFMQLGADFGKALMLGSFVVGLVTAICSYWVGLLAFQYLKANPRKKR